MTPLYHQAEGLWEAVNEAPRSLASEPNPLVSSMLRRVRTPALTNLWGRARRSAGRLRHAPRTSPGPVTALSCAMLLACHGKATRKECDEMLDKYVDMVVDGEVSHEDLPSEEAHAAREMKKALRRAEPSYARVERQCESEITKREYRCAMKAPNPETWQACID